MLCRRVWVCEYIYMCHGWFGWKEWEQGSLRIWTVRALHILKICVWRIASGADVVNMTERYTIHVERYSPYSPEPHVSRKQRYSLRLVGWCSWGHDLISEQSSVFHSVIRLWFGQHDWTLHNPCGSDVHPTTLSSVEYELSWYCYSLSRETHEILLIS